MARILIIDDDANLRRALGRGLAQHGHEVMEAADGVEGMANIKGELPDLVITDINMPEMDGIEIINELRSMTPPVPVLAISGGGRLPKEMLLDTASALGAMETLEKPFDMNGLMAAVGRLLPDGGG